MSRFARMTPDERAGDAAFSRSPDDCDHPPECRTDRDSGGTQCSSTYYCTSCNRVVFESSS